MGMPVGHQNGPRGEGIRNNSRLRSVLIQGISAGFLEKSHIGAKGDFEIWAFKVFFSLDQKKGPKEGL